MRYLLDVNALVALGLMHHEFHSRVASWVRAQRAPELVTCSITELGFVRVLAQAPAYGLTVTQARTLLMRLKKTSVLSFTFVPDANDIAHLPVWVKTPKQITDGHLSEIARENGALLTTLDGRIPDAYLIPQRHGRI